MVKIDTDIVKHNFLSFLKRHSNLAKKIGYLNEDLHSRFIKEYGYTQFGCVFYDEVWSSDKRLAKSPIKDEQYDDLCFRIRPKFSQDIIFLSNIFNIWLKKNKGCLFENTQPSLNAMEIDKLLREHDNRLSNCIYMKNSDISHIIGQINKFDELVKTFDNFTKVA